MNGKKAKKLRREILGNLSLRNPGKYLFRVRDRAIVLSGPFRAYREAKKQIGVRAARLGRAFEEASCPTPSGSLPERSA
jgi:hypothetical protein